MALVSARGGLATATPLVRIALAAATARRIRRTYFFVSVDIYLAEILLDVLVPVVRLVVRQVAMVVLVIALATTTAAAAATA